MEFAAGVLFLSPQGRVLLMRRTDGEGWAFPGGGIEPNEDAEAAARREVLEETGHDFRGPLRPWIRQQMNGVDFTTFLAEEKEFEPVFNHEHDAYRWVKPTDALTRADAAVFKESEHPRDEDGKFGSGGGGRKLAASSQRAWDGKPAGVDAKLSKAEIGSLGEDLAVEFLKSNGFADAKALHVKTSENFPLDLVGDHGVFEVKTGIASSTTPRWRITIGQPGVKETAWLKRASPEAKAKLNRRKVEAAIARKKQIIRQLSREAGKKLKGATIALIVNPDTKCVDIYQFDGFHANVGWNGELASKSYVGSYSYG